MAINGEKPKKQTREKQQQQEENWWHDDIHSAKSKPAAPNAMTMKALDYDSACTQQKWKRSIIGSNSKTNSLDIIHFWGFWEELASRHRSFPLATLIS